MTKLLLLYHTITIEAGGVTTTPTVLSLQKYKTLIEEAEDFIKNRYLPNIISIAKQYKEYFKIGKGYTNYLSFAYFADENGTNHMFTGGFVSNNQYEDYDLTKIMEDIKYSYYEDNALQLTPIQYDTYKKEKLKKMVNTAGVKLQDMMEK